MIYERHEVMLEWTMLSILIRESKNKIFEVPC